MGLLAFAILLASAQPAVSWQGPPGCARPDGLEHAIVRRLGRATVPGEIEIHGTVVQEPDGFLLALRTDIAGRISTRTLRATTCDELVEAAALIAAVSLASATSSGSNGSDGGEGADVNRPDDSTSVGPADGEPPIAATVVAPPPTAPPRPAGPSKARRNPRSSRPPRRPLSRTKPSKQLQASFGADAGLILGATPGPNAVVSGFASFGIDRVRGEIAGAYATPRVGVGRRGRVRVQLGLVATRVCGRPGFGPVQLALCGGLELGALRGDGMDAPRARTAHGLWLAVLASAGLTWWTRPRVGLNLRVEGAVPLWRPRFELRNPRQPLFTPAPIGGRVVVGVEVRFDQRR